VPPKQQPGERQDERDACLRLGLTDDDMERFVPLPFFAVYTDLLSCIAEIDPLGFCFSLVVSEELPGTCKPIAAALAARGFTAGELQSHTQIDIERDHTSFARRLARQWPSVSPDRFATAARHMLFMVEVSTAARDQLMSYCLSGKARDMAPAVFSLRPDDVLSMRL